jgi:hypothetical protein
MNDVTTKPETETSFAKKAWQSDVIVDLIKHYGFPYIAGQLRRQQSAAIALPA